MTASRLARCVIADSQVVTHACAKDVMVLTLAFESPGRVPLLRLSGTIERGESSENLVSAIRRLLDAGSHIVMCDLSGISSIDSTGISALISAHELAKKLGGRFVLIRPSTKVRSVLQVTRLIDLLDVCDDENAALRDTGDGSGDISQG